MKIILLNIFNDEIIPDENFPDYGKTLYCTYILHITWMWIPLKISATEHLNGFSTGLVGALNVSTHAHTHVHTVM